MAERIVKCSKLGREAPGLERPPFAGSVGEEVFNRVSAEAWALWRDNMMIKVINEYRLNMADPDHFAVLVEQMRAFLGLDSSQEVLEVENPERSRSGQ